MDGVAGLVPGGAVADAVLALDREELVLVSGRHRAESKANIGRLPVASWNLADIDRQDERIVMASGADARAAMETAAAEWKLLSAAFLAGLSRQALDAASAYARERVQFGRPIGTFQGLTLFVVPTTLPGYEAQPVHTYQDERTNITFYSDMRVPDRYRLGEAGKGALIMGAALTLEHGGGNYFSGHVRMMRNALQWASSTDEGGSRPIDDASVRLRLAQVRARHEVAACFVARGIWGAEGGQALRSWGPMAKVFITESFLQSCWDILEMGGPVSILTGTHPLGIVELDHRRAYGTTIYGGTSEIHRSIIAEQALGLPKSRS